MTDSGRNAGAILAAAIALVRLLLPVVRAHVQRRRVVFTERVSFARRRSRRGRAMKLRDRPRASIRSDAPVPLREGLQSRRPNYTRARVQSQQLRAAVASHFDRRRSGRRGWRRFDVRHAEVARAFAQGARRSNATQESEVAANDRAVSSCSSSCTLAQHERSHGRTRAGALDSDLGPTDHARQRREQPRERTQSAQDCRLKRCRRSRGWPGVGRRVDTRSTSRCALRLSLSAL